jgi:hypothetical protein
MKTKKLGTLGTSVGDGVDAVVVTPNQQGRKAGREMQPVEGANRLAALVDDRPQGAQERRPGGAIRQR